MKDSPSYAILPLAASPHSLNDLRYPFKNLKPQKGKGLLLLRTLNDLLRRVSKTGSTTTFCGRILNLLSSVFPLCERSAVNLRGEYGPPWEGVLVVEPTVAPMEDVQKTEPTSSVAVGVDVKDEATSKTAPPRTEAEKKFYKNFWSLQAPFSQPQLFAQRDTMSNFKAAVDAVLPVIAETTKKERVLMGSRNGPTAVKRKRGDGEVDNGLAEDAGTGSKYFFAKYLTSPELLDFEVSFIACLCISRLNMSSQSDGRHAIPATSPVSAIDTPSAPSQLHENGKTKVADCAKSFAADGFHAR